MSIKGKSFHEPEDLEKIYHSILNNMVYGSRLRRLERVQTLLKNHERAIACLEAEHEFLVAQIGAYEKPFEIPSPTILGIIQGKMDQKGLSQSDVSRNTGITPTRMSEYLNGKRKISTKAAQTLSQFFDIPLDLFFTRPNPEGEQP